MNFSRLNPQQTHISEKRPLNKKVFAKFIKVSELGSSKIEKKLRFLLKKSALRESQNLNQHNTQKQGFKQDIKDEEGKNIEVEEVLYEPIMKSKLQSQRQSIYIQQSVDPNQTHPHGNIQERVDQLIQQETSEGTSIIISHQFFVKKDIHTQQQQTINTHYNNNAEEQTLFNDPSQQVVSQKIQEAQKVQNEKKKTIGKYEQVSFLKAQKETNKYGKKSAFVFNNFQTLHTRTIPEELNQSSYSLYSDSNLELNETQRFTSQKDLQTQNSNQNIVVCNQQISPDPAKVQAQINPNNSIQQNLQHQSQTQDLNSKLYSKIKPKENPQNSQQIYVQEEYQNGGRYEGYLINGQKNGFGTFYYKNGGYYQGMWRNNSMNGQGKLYYDNGKLAYDGQWYQNEFHGKGKVYNDTAIELTQPFDYTDFNSNIEDYWTHYEGQLSHDTKVGYGKISFSNGEYFEGTFSDDNIHGRGKFHSLRNNREVVRGIWNKGVLVEVIEIIPEKQFDFLKECDQDENRKQNYQSKDHKQETQEAFNEILLKPENKLQIMQDIIKPYQAQQV